MSAAPKHQEFHDDGTPKRKYELEERPDSNVAVRAAIGLVLANAFILLKNILPWGGANAERAPGGGLPDGQGKPVAESTAVAALEDAPSPLRETAGEEPEEQIGSGTGIHLISAREAFVPDEKPEDTRRHSSGRPASNDNEQLYGAKPGAAVDLNDPNSAASASASAGSGGGGGADPSDGGDDDDHGGGHNGQHDDEDDDEDTDNPHRPNRLPVITAPVILADLFANDSRVINFSDLLRNASDPDGDALRVVNLSAPSGTLVQRGDGSWYFTPEPDDTSHVTFTYGISDGKGEVAQHASLDLVARNSDHIEGTPGADTLVGTPHADVIVALAGTDTVLAREGNDIVHGGEGNDRIIAGDGEDVVYAGEGGDVVYAGKGNDAVFGGPGNDVLFGEEDDDTLVGEDGSDTLSGGDGDDVLAGGADDDKLDGDAGKDSIDGGSGTDVIDGGAGDDSILAGLGDDKAVGGDGNDVFIAFIGDGDDIYAGGAGSDTYDASGVVAAVSIDLVAATATGDDIGSDIIKQIENARGGAGDDVLTASDATNMLAGGSGADLFVFASARAAGLGVGTRDRILDFAVGDQLDFDDISAEFAASLDGSIDDAGIRRFVLISQGLEFSRPGEVRFKYDAVDDAPVTILEGNVDYDADADFELEIAGVYEFRDSDFHWRS